MTQPRTTLTLARLCCGVMVVTGVGCQMYSPYGYNGYPGGYPAYSQPGQVMPYGASPFPQGTGLQPIPQQGYSNGYPPAGALPPGGTMTPATPTPNVPNGGYNPNVPSAGYPQGVDNSGETLGQPGAFPPSGGTRPRMPREENLDKLRVPDYADPNGPSVQNNKRPAAPSVDIGEPDDFSGELNGQQKSTEKLKKMETSGIPNESAMLGPAFQGSELTPAVTRQVASADEGVIQTAQHVEAGQAGPELRPYGRAADGRSWFRGLVDYDEQEKAWYLIYNPEPSASDKRGGTIILVEHPHLQMVTGDDVVLVEGDFDPTVTDRHGNVKYRASIVRRLVP